METVQEWEFGGGDGRVVAVIRTAAWGRKRNGRFGVFNSCKQTLSGPVPLLRLLLFPGLNARK